MKTTKLTLIIFLAFIFSKLVQAQDCNVWLDNMATEVESGNTGEAVKAMKWFVNCKGNELGLENPIIKNLETIGYIGRFDNGHAVCVLKGGKYTRYAIINESFTEITPMENYFHILDFSEGMAAAKPDFNGKWGYIDGLGKEIISARYDEAAKFSGGLAAVKSNGKWGYIDRTGNQVIPFKFEEAGNFSENHSIVKYQGKYRIIDSAGNETMDLKYDRTEILDTGSALVSRKKEKGLINSSGYEVAPLEKYSDISTFFEGLARVNLNGKRGFIDQRGNLAIAPEYEEGNIFKEGFAAVKLNGKWGFIDRNGKEIIPFIYDDAAWFSEGLAAVNSGGKYGYVNMEGKEVIPFLFDDAGQFSTSSHSGETSARVEMNGKWFHIDKSGKCVKNCQNAPASHL